MNLYEFEWMNMCLLRRFRLCSLPKMDLREREMMSLGEFESE